METERTYETYLTLSPLYVITGDIWRKTILCANVHNMGYREKRGAKLCRKTKNLRTEPTQKNMNAMAVTSLRVFVACLGESFWLLEKEQLSEFFESIKVDDW